MFPMYVSNIHGATNYVGFLSIAHGRVRDQRKFKYTVYQCAVRVALIYNLVYESVTPMGNIFWLSVAIITTHWKCSKRPDSNLEHVPSLIRDSLSNTQKAYVISHSHMLFVPIQTWNIFECRSGNPCILVDWKKEILNFRFSIQFSQFILYQTAR